MTWLPLDPVSINSPVIETRGGGKLRVFVSPYDVPEAMRSFFDKDLHRLIIEFRYLSGDEPLSKESVEDHVTLHIGKSSNRLYRIELDVVALEERGVNSIHLEQRISNAIKGLSRLPHQTPRLGNYRLVRQAISDRKAELFSSEKR